MIKEDKVSLSHKRAELVTRLGGPLPPEERVRIQGDLSLLNAKIKALNTTEAAQLKARADQRKIAGLAEAQANAARARARGPGGPSTPEEIEEAPDPISTLDAWIDAVLLRHDVDFVRGGTGKVVCHNPEWANVIEILIDGLYAVAQGQKLPDLPAEPPRAAPEAKKTAKPKKRTRGA